jgi:hypothetical protein
MSAADGFVPQSPPDFWELTDSTMVRNAKKGHKGNFFIQFSAKDYVLESRPKSSDLVSQQADLPSYCLGSIRFLFDQSR